MSWRNRRDEPGAEHFVTVKGVGGLPIFSRRDDIRFFLSLVAREVRRGELRVHAFSFVWNHAHFLVQSPRGTLCRPWKRILEKYARYYNAGRERQGHLFKDRFHSTAVLTEAYFVTLVGYTDHNAVRAKLTPSPEAWEFGSARYYVGDRPPPWLSRDRVLAYVPGPEAYLSTFCPPDPEFVSELLQRRGAAEAELDDPVDLFLSPDPAPRRAWLLEQADARLIAKADHLTQVLADRGLTSRTLKTGLLRLACGRSYGEILELTGLSGTTAAREVQRHREALRRDPAYLATADAVLTEAVRRTWGEVGNP